MPRYVSLPEGTERLRAARRVLVIGCSGGGKTTLALAISERLGLPHRSIDRDAHWLPGWRERDPDERRRIIAAMVAEERWVMDGTSAGTFDLRLPRTDLAIWLRVPRRVALLGIVRRVAANHGRVRAAMPTGCPEKLPDREFLSYIWHFERRSAPSIIAMMDRHGPDIPVVMPRSRRDAWRLLDGQAAGY